MSSNATGRKNIARFEQYMREKHGESPAQSLREQSKSWHRRAESLFTSGEKAMRKSQELAAMAHSIESNTEKLK